MENSQLKRKRGKNFTSQEEVMLVELVDDQRDVIESKKSDAVTWKQKEEAWKKLAERFTARIGVQREWKTLRDKFESLKRKSKAEMASEKCELYRTGGGSAAVRSNSVITQKVATILGESATGMENAFDGDAVDISTPEKSKVHHEKPNNSDELNQENLEIIDVEGEEWSSWTPNSLRTRKSSKLLVDRPVTRKRTLEEEKTKLAVFQQKFYEEENARAKEKHEQELIALQLKNELLQLEIIEKKAKLDSNNNVS